MKRVAVFAFGAFLTMAAATPPARAADPADPQTPASFEKTICRDVKLDYLLYKPKGYGDDAAKTWPLILFLHGSGERGNELFRVEVNGLPNEIAHGFEVPAVVVSPQCPSGMRWENDTMVEALNALLDDATTRYRVDPKRVYLTGLSMGGFGTWALAAAHPERFAAIAPVCGGGDPDDAVRLRRLPIWAFHGAKDDVVPISNMYEMRDALARAHGNMKTTVYPEANHNSWSQAYADSTGLCAWLLAHEKTEPKLVAPGSAQLTASTGDAAKAFDGDPATRWESEWKDPQWLQIDLGRSVPMTRMVITWETAFAKAYDVLAQPKDGGTLTTVARVTDGDGAVDVIDFPKGFAARRLRLDMAARGTQWGDSIWEIELERP